MATTTIDRAQRNRQFKLIKALVENYNYLYDRDYRVEIIPCKANELGYVKVSSSEKENVIHITKFLATCSEAVSMSILPFTDRNDNIHYEIY